MRMIECADAYIKYILWEYMGQLIILINEISYLMKNVE